MTFLHLTWKVATPEPDSMEHGQYWKRSHWERSQSPVGLNQESSCQAVAPHSCASSHVWRKQLLGHMPNTLLALGIRSYQRVNLMLLPYAKLPDPLPSLTLGNSSEENHQDNTLCHQIYLTDCLSVAGLLPAWLRLVITGTCQFLALSSWGEHNMLGSGTTLWCVCGSLQCQMANGKKANGEKPQAYVKL